MSGETSDALDNFCSGSYGARRFRLDSERVDVPLGRGRRQVRPARPRTAPVLPRWAWQWITGLALIAFLIMGAIAGRNFTEAAADRARFDEEFADSQLACHYRDAAKFTLRNAARNWRFALRFDEATRVENRIKELEKHAAQD